MYLPPVGLNIPYNLKLTTGPGKLYCAVIDKNKIGQNVEAVHEKAKYILIASTGVQRVG